MMTFAAVWSNELKQAIVNAQGATPYSMSLVGDDIETVTDAVNQGIDAHLEACFIPDRGDSYDMVQGDYVTRLECSVSAESLPVLIRRILESNNEYLAIDICSTLDIELV